MASRGRESVGGALCHALANTLPVGFACYADTPVRCSLIHTFTPLAAITSIPHGIVITAHCQHKVSHVPMFASLHIVTHDERITAQSASARWAVAAVVRLHIPQQNGASEPKRKRGRWGVFSDGG